MCGNTDLGGLVTGLAILLMEYVHSMKSILKVAKQHTNIFRDGIKAYVCMKKRLKTKKIYNI